jgi:hypothetical protein
MFTTLHPESVPLPSEGKVGRTFYGYNSCSPLNKVLDLLPAESAWISIETRDDARRTRMLGNGVLRHQAQRTKVRPANTVY